MLISRARAPFAIKKHPLYSVWANMRRRCNDPKNKCFAYYGGRGISVCAEWDKSFQLFVADMSPRPSPEHSLEREDNNGNYGPLNCKWATRKEQGRNKRSNVWLSVNGETKTITEWSAKTGIQMKTLAYRVKAGCSPEDCLAPRVYKSTSAYLTVGETTKTVTEWAAITGIPRARLYYRKNSGLSPERCLQP